MKHSYDTACQCPRCTRERARRARQSEQDRPIAAVMLDWTRSPHRRRARIAREYWDRHESGAPMSSDDY